MYNASVDSAVGRCVVHVGTVGRLPAVVSGSWVVRNELESPKELKKRYLILPEQF